MEKPIVNDYSGIAEALKKIEDEKAPKTMGRDPSIAAALGDEKSTRVQFVITAGFDSPATGEDKTAVINSDDSVTTAMTAVGLPSSSVIEAAIERAAKTDDALAALAYSHYVPVKTDPKARKVTFEDAGFLGSPTPEYDNDLMNRLFPPNVDTNDGYYRHWDAPRLLKVITAYGSLVLDPGYITLAGELMKEKKIKAISDDRDRIILVPYNYKEV